MYRRDAADAVHAHLATLPADLSGLGRPFSRSEALDCGITDHALRTLTEAGALRRPLHGVYVPHHHLDTMESRLAALALVAPPSAVVVDETASWVYIGDAALAPGEHLRPRDLRVFDRRSHHHSPRKGLRTGARALLDHDVVEVGSLQVTTPLRTACDVARLTDPLHALAILDRFEKEGLASGPSVAAGLTRFRGFRGVRMARVLATWVDGRSDSFGESGLRFRWRETPGLPVPIPQLPVERPDGGLWFLDLGLDELPFGAEYDGIAFHGPEHREHDLWRRGVMRDSLGLRIEVFDSTGVLGRKADAGSRIAAAIRELRERRPTVIDLHRRQGGLAPSGLTGVDGPPVVRLGGGAAAQPTPRGG